MKYVDAQSTICLLKNAIIGTHLSAAASSCVLRKVLAILRKVVSDSVFLLPFV